MAFLNRCRPSRLLFVLLFSHLLVSLAFSAAFGEPVASMGKVNIGASSFLLQNGRVLVLLGHDTTHFGYGGEIYDRYTNRWSPTASTAMGRDEFTATQLSDGRILVAGGWTNGYPPQSAEIYDPVSDRWQPAGPMGAWRARHAAVLLPSGKVLVTGGYDENGDPLTSAEMYDPASNSWSPVPGMTHGRLSHTATLLPGGKVLVAGGALSSDIPSLSYTASAEIFDPAAGTWSAAANLIDARGMHQATVLNDGRVLVTGGMDPVGNGLQETEIYDPVANAWTSAGTLSYGRYAHSATLLKDGTVLVAGGETFGSEGPSTSTEIFDPALSLWQHGGDLPNRMTSHTATLLLNGQVLLAGGFLSWGSTSSPALLYTPTGVTPNPPRALSLTMQGRGSVRSTPPGLDCLEGVCSADFTIDTPVTLVAAEVPGYVFTGWSGCDQVSSNLCTVKLYANRSVTAQYGVGPARFLPAGSLQHHSEGHTATLLANGKVLVTGGGDAWWASYMDTALYDPGADSWTAAHPMSVPRSQHTATLLSDGRVLVVGGDWSANYLGYVGEFYDPAMDRWGWTAPTAYHGYRKGHTATLLPSGKVLVAGGGDSSSLAWTELYTPSKLEWDYGSWDRAGDLAQARQYHTATLTSDGRVVVVGGTGANGSALSSVEFYRSSTNLWTTGPSLANARTGHTATLLADGRVLVVGGLGQGGAVASAEIFDPATDSWSPAGNLAAPRTQHTATLLPSGKVLVAGGKDSSATAISSAELFDPVSGQWSAAEPLIDARAGHTATLLESGDTLVVGGVAALNTLSTAERYGPGELAPGDVTAPSSAITSAYVHLVLDDVQGTATDGAGAGVRRVDVSLDGGITWAPASGTINWIYRPGPIPNGEYTILSRATDYAGNVESPGSGVSVTVAAPLNVTVTSPAQGAVVTGGALTISGSVSRHWWIDRVEVTLDGGATWHLATGRDAWTCTLPNVNEGSYTVQARVRDEAGNVSLSAPLNLVVRPAETGDPNSAPLASFTGTPLSGYAPLPVNLIDTSTNTPTSWSWEFGDGASSNLRDPLHVFSNPGSYRVKLTVSNPAGSDVREVYDYISVQACPYDPVRLLSGSYYGTVQEAFDTAASGATIQAQAIAFSGDVVLSRDVDLVLKGGYDCGYSTNPVVATIDGSLSIASGTLQVENLVLQ